jgi:hypothetical protein
MHLGIAVFYATHSGAFRGRRHAAYLSVVFNILWLAAGLPQQVGEREQVTRSVVSASEPFIPDMT